MKSPKVLVFDVETSPILAHVWQLFDQTIPLNQIKKDWVILSWAAKWLNDSPDKIMYQDQRNVKNVNNDKKLLKGIWKLLDEADVVVTQNGVRFDSKKLNARFIQNGMKPPSPYKHIDTYKIAKKHFAFTSNKLEYMSDKLCTKYKKLKHAKFAGFELWKECLAGNQEAWQEMEKYNKYDVLTLEELYHKLAAWDNTVNFNVYTEDNKHMCNCGSYHTVKKGFQYTKTQKFQQYVCRDCGAWSRSSINLLSKKKKESLRRI